MKTLLLLLPVACFGMLASPSRAQVIPVGNYSFTSPGLPGTYDASDSATSNDDPSQTEEEYSLVPDLGFPGGVGSAGGGGATNQYVPDWTTTTSGGVAGVDNPVASMFPGTGGSSSDGLLPGTADGYTFGFINLQGTGSTGSMTYSGPSLGNFAIGQTYTLTLAAGWRADQAASTYAIELLNNGVAVNTPVFYTASTQGSFADLPSLTFTDTGDTGSIGIAILAVNDGKSNTGFEQAVFDNVRLVETPEPSTYAEILGGCLLLGLVVWYQRQLRA